MCKGVQGVFSSWHACLFGEMRSRGITCSHEFRPLPITNACYWTMVGTSNETFQTHNPSLTSSGEDSGLEDDILISMTADMDPTLGIHYYIYLLSCSQRLSPCTSNNPNQSYNSYLFTNHPKPQPSPARHPLSLSPHFPSPHFFS